MLSTIQYYLQLMDTRKALQKADLSWYSPPSKLGQEAKQTSDSLAVKNQSPKSHVVWSISKVNMITISIFTSLKDLWENLKASSQPESIHLFSPWKKWGQGVAHAHFLQEVAHHWRDIEPHWIPTDGLMFQLLIQELKKTLWDQGARDPSSEIWGSIKGPFPNSAGSKSRFSSAFSSIPSRMYRAPGIGTRFRWWCLEMCQGFNNCEWIAYNCKQRDDRSGYIDAIRSSWIWRYVWLDHNQVQPLRFNCCTVFIGILGDVMNSLISLTNKNAKPLCTPSTRLINWPYIVKTGPDWWPCSLKKINQSPRLLPLAQEPGPDHCQPPWRRWLLLNAWVRLSNSSWRNFVHVSQQSDNSFFTRPKKKQKEERWISIKKWKSFGHFSSGSKISAQLMKQDETVGHDLKLETVTYFWDENVLLQYTGLGMSSIICMWHYTTRIICMWHYTSLTLQVKSRT